MWYEKVRRRTLKEEDKIQGKSKKDNFSPFIFSILPLLHSVAYQVTVNDLLLRHTQLIFSIPTYNHQYPFGCIINQQNDLWKVPWSSENFTVLNERFQSTFSNSFIPILIVYFYLFPYKFLFFFFTLKTTNRLCPVRSGRLWDKYSIFFLIQMSLNISENLEYCNLVVFQKWWHSDIQVFIGRQDY